MNKSFDAYLAERRQTRSNTFEIFGETHVLPPTLPYDAVLLFKSLETRQQEEEVTDSEVTDIFNALVGKEIHDKLKEHVEFDIELMIQVMSFVLEAYGVSDKTPKRKRAASR